MGKNKLLWPFPYIGDAGRPNGDGVVFPKKEQNRRDSTWEMQDNDIEDDKKENEFNNPLMDFAKEKYPT